MRRRSNLSRARRAHVKDEALQIQAACRLKGLTADQIQGELLRAFPGELESGEARMYAEGWTVRTVREGLRKLATIEGQDASGLGDIEVWRWLRGEVYPRDWLQRLCTLFRCHQAQLGWPARGNEIAVDHSVRSGAPGVQASARVGGVDHPAMASPMERRTVLLAGAAIALPTVSLDDLTRIISAFLNAPRHLDATSIDLFREQIAACAATDGAHGARRALPLVLGMIGAVERGAGSVRPEARRQLLSVGAECGEFAGWLYRDVGLPEMANYWRDRAIEWAQEAGDGTMQGYVLLRKSQAAWDERDAVRMLTLAQAVQEGPWELPPKVHAEAVQQKARAHAMLGADIDQVERTLDEARCLLELEHGTWTERRGGDLSAHYTSSVLAMQTALCYHEAGRPRTAVEIYSTQLTRSAFSNRDYGYFLSLKSGALAAAGEPDEASMTGLEALAIALATNSGRSVRELSTTADRLRPWSRRPAVREFQEAVGR